MNVPLPAKIIKSDEEWNKHLCEHVPALAKLRQKGKHEQFEEFKLLSGLDYVTFMQSHVSQWTQSLSAQIASVQPMSAPTGEIFHFKTKNS